MEDLIKQIIKIENDAQDIVHAARKKLAGFDTDLEAEFAAMRDKISADAERKIAQLEQSEAEELAAKVAEIEAEAQQQLAALDKNYEEDAAKWESDILERLLAD